MEAYKRVGRGGAGNFYSKKDDVQDVIKTSSTDHEAQTPQILARVPSIPLPAPEYQHTGRGGAGNWVAPADLAAQTLTTSTFPTSPAAVPKITAQSRSKPTYRGGRGGAGNYVDSAEEERVRRIEEERIRREIEEAIGKDVEAGMARPERAYRGLGGSWEMGSMK